DRSLIANLEKCQKFLGFRYLKFLNRFEQYKLLEEKVDQSLQKFQGYQAFNTMESESQEKFKKSYGLLKLWELNSKAKSLPERDPILSLRHYLSSEKSLGLFKEYYQVLRKKLFEKSMSFKQNAPELFMGTGKDQVKEDLASLRAETHTLGVTIAKYRDFL